MPILSLDPRVNRLQAEQVSAEQGPVLAPGDHWPSYQVFHQRRRGEKHSSVGIVHAPSSEMAMALAKEQYGRRGETSNLWVVCSADVWKWTMPTRMFFVPRLPNPIGIRPGTK